MSVKGRRRLDAELVRRGLSTSRSEAREAIARGQVLVAGAVADKPARLVAVSEPVRLVGPPPRYVSRGGLKLEAALDRFPVPVRGRAALDVGASTGGFTDCLLQRGAARVTALDVGHGQLHERLRADARVVVVERVNVRTARLDELGGVAFPLVVADLSFISLATVAPSLVGLAAADADLVVLVKPQFEAARRDVARGRGVVRDPAVWGTALRTARDALATSGATMMEAMVSPLTGADGNVEFLAHLTTSHGAPLLGDAHLDAVVAEARARTAVAEP